MILGGGFAGLAIARRLEAKLHEGEAQTVLVSRENFMLFTPMLPEVSSGELDVRHVVTPIRSQLRSTRFILADARSLDVRAATVELVHTLGGQVETLAYEQLVLALGSTISTFGLPGVAEHVFALKTLEDAGILRNRFVWLLELADSIEDPAERTRLLTIVVVGGGFTGVEATGELVELFRSVVRFYPHVHRDDLRVVLVEGGPTLLPGLPKKMGEYSDALLRARGVEIITNDGVASADAASLFLRSGRRIDTRTIVWSAGVKPAATLRDTPLPHTQRGAIVVESDFRVPGFPNVWAAGDCAAIPDGNGAFYPPTAQHAIREGPVLADNLVAVLRGTRTTAFRFSALGMMASLGGRKAVAQLPGDRVLTGFLAWFLWRSYYLMRLPSLERRLRVAFDWMLELLFPRDIAELRIYTRNAQSSAAADAGLPPRSEPPQHL